MRGCDAMKGNNFLIALLIWMALIFPACAQQLDMHYFTQMPIVHDGRLKPMGRMAQLTLQKITREKQSIADSTQWLAALLFDPSDADKPAIFKVENALLRHKLGLKENAEAHYSFKELNDAMVRNSELILSIRDKNAKDLTKQEAALFELYATVITYEQLKDAMTLFLPLKTEGGQPVSLVDLPAEVQEKDIYKNLISKGENNLIFLAVPVRETDYLPWVTPWMTYRTGNPVKPFWNKLAAAYVTQDNAAWQQISKTLYEKTLTEASEENLDFRLKTELLYLAVNPYLVSLCLYALGMVFIALKRRQISLAMISAGMGFHVLGLVARIIILQRPPVSDLYESLLFVGVIVVALALLYGWRKKENAALITASTLGIILHLVGFWLGGEYDTFKVLQAVLDTKFWLATHVLIITGGYALCLLTSAMAHYCLWRYPGGRKTRNKLYLMALVSLVFICTGTLLGGIWADQSWGRFWGWDPKENGALLIALWLIWLLHGRISRHISDFYFVMGMAALGLVVAMSWIGVNLLGVGLHSYGFLQGSVSGLVALFIIELSYFFYCKRRHV